MEKSHGLGTQRESNKEKLPIIFFSRRFWVKEQRDFTTKHFRQKKAYLNASMVALVSSTPHPTCYY